MSGESRCLNTGRRHCTALEFARVQQSEPSLAVHSRSVRTKQAKFFLCHLRFKAMDGHLPLGFL